MKVIIKKKKFWLKEGLLVKKKLKITFNSPIVLGFVIACFVVMVINFLSFGKSTPLLFMTVHSPLDEPLTYVRFFTHVLGHADWEHYVGNMMYILLLGPLLEEKYGSGRIVQVIIVTALVTGLINYLFFWKVALCGASGVCFAFILLSSFTSFKEGELPLTVVLVAVIFLGQQVYDGLMLDDNISNMAHIFGGIVGGVIGTYLNKRK